MMNSEFRMRRQRRFGEVLNTSFAFVRMHYKVLVQSLVQLVLPLLIIVAGVILLTVLLFSSQLFEGRSNDDAGFGAILLVITVGFICMLAMASALGLASAVYYSVVKLALQKNAEFDVKDVRKEVKGMFWKIVGLYLLQIILSYLIATVIYLPGIILSGIVGASGANEVETMIVLELVLMLMSGAIQVAVAGYMALSYPVLILEKRPLFESIQRSYRLVRGNFWSTASVQFCMYLIVYCMMMAPLAHPILLYGVLRALLDPVAMASWLISAKVVSITLGTLYGLFCLCAFVFIWVLNAVVLSFQYLSIVEAREGLGLALRIHESIPPVPAPSVQSVEQAWAAANERVGYDSRPALEIDAQGDGIDATPSQSDDALSTENSTPETMPNTSGSAEGSVQENPSTEDTSSANEDLA